MKHKVIVVVGPTAVGKTKIAIELAKKYQLEIISGDSVAVYRGLDIGSAKPTKEEQNEVVHHLIDVLDPIEQYSVADFQKEARKWLDRLPISLICGGTGLYIQAALFNYEFTAQKRDANFDAAYQTLSNQELYDLLLKEDPDLSKDKIHPNNRKRILRALEVLKTSGRSIHSFKRNDEALYDYFIVYLSMERSALYERINQRVDQMISDGLIEEVFGLYQKQIYPKAIGYQELYPYFKGEISLLSAVEEIKKNTRHLAKRQETWFKNQMTTHFYEVCPNNTALTLQRIEKDIEEWMKSK